MQTFKAYSQEPDGTMTELPDVVAQSEAIGSFVAATRWLTVRLNAGSAIDGMVMTLGSGRTRVLLDSG